MRFVQVGLPCFAFLPAGPRALLSLASRPRRELLLPDALPPAFLCPCLRWRPICLQSHTTEPTYSIPRWRSDNSDTAGAPARRDRDLIAFLATSLLPVFFVDPKGLFSPGTAAETWLSHGPVSMSSSLPSTLADPCASPGHHRILCCLLWPLTQLHTTLSPQVHNRTRRRECCSAGIPETPRKRKIANATIIRMLIGHSYCYCKHEAVCPSALSGMLVPVLPRKGQGLGKQTLQDYIPIMAICSRACLILPHRDIVRILTPIDRDDHCLKIPI